MERQWDEHGARQRTIPFEDFYENSFVEEEGRRMGETLEDIRAWQPPVETGRKARRKWNRGDRSEFE